MKYFKPTSKEGGLRMENGNAFPVDGAWVDPSRKWYRRMIGDEEIIEVPKKVWPPKDESKEKVSTDAKSKEANSGKADK